MREPYPSPIRPTSLCSDLVFVQNTVFNPPRVCSFFHCVCPYACGCGSPQGSITTWLDPRLTALNPGGLVDAVGQNLSDASRHIALLRSPEATADPFEDLMRAFDPAYSGTQDVEAGAFVPLRMFFDLNGKHTHDTNQVWGKGAAQLVGIKTFA